ncbi:MAG TPA: hypothetical protein VGN64_19980 [Dyadobacter sp.]|jgi:hypothetical protein|nr:hypothetical protein [Dyadobacter sp.]
MNLSEWFGILNANDYAKNILHLAVACRLPELMWLAKQAESFFEGIFLQGVLIQSGRLPSADAVCFMGIHVVSLIEQLNA